MTADIPMSAHGLKRDCLSYGEVIAQSIAVIAPTTTPAANLGLIFALSGNGTWLSFLIGLVGLVFVSININQFARRSASPGSLYTYIAKSLGATAGVMCAWGLILAYLFTGMAVLCGFANFGQEILSHLGIHTHILTLLAIGAGISCYAAYKDIQLSAKAMLWLEGVSIGLIALLGVIIWAHKGFAIDFSQLTLQNTTPGGVAMGVVMVVFGFSGFESATSLGDEARKPLKNIPKAVMQSTIQAGIFFIFMAYIEVLGFSGTSVSLAESEAPLTFLADQAGVGFLGALISLGVLLSFFACILACINPAARVFFMMARHGLLPDSLGTTHDTNLTPHTAIALSSIVTFTVPAVMNSCGLQPFESMGYLGTLCTYGFLLVYILVSLAAPVYLYRLGKLRPMDIVFSMLGVGFMMIPIVGMVGIPGSELFPVPEAPYNLFPYLFLLYLMLGCGWFMVQRIRSPKLVRRMQREIEAIHLSFSNPKG
ncbi:MAG: APC family permease [Drouetiella hepatica Uher 2000/2452]|jgi:amino acid transporter|uniref:APC family permease n=1 Tax=Drouetiella hepatica Uher 2000/2452 TaxID=904376 RepID=A0A951ULN6_9CYAN|nr:APC family permease [Drouetiella hepatica Uher 2000/2452]